MLSWAPIDKRKHCKIKYFFIQNTAVFERKLYYLSGKPNLICYSHF